MRKTLILTALFAFIGFDGGTGLQRLNRESTVSRVCAIRRIACIGFDIAVPSSFDTCPGAKGEQALSGSKKRRLGRGCNVTCSGDPQASIGPRLVMPQ
jgi:hypothetical protein